MKLEYHFLLAGVERRWGGTDGGAGAGAGTCASFSLKQRFAPYQRAFEAIERSHAKPAKATLSRLSTTYDTQHIHVPDEFLAVGPVLQRTPALCA